MGSLETYNDLPFFIFGDFNCRVGQIASIEEELLQETNLFSNMQSMDNLVKPEGRILLEFMYENNFSLINGSIAGDRPANYTYVDKGKM